MVRSDQASLIRMSSLTISDYVADIGTLTDWRWSNPSLSAIQSSRTYYQLRSS
jgi:hypothetical protein